MPGRARGRPKLAGTGRPDCRDDEPRWSHLGKEAPVPNGAQILFFPEPVEGEREKGKKEGKRRAVIKRQNAREQAGGRERA